MFCTSLLPSLKMGKATKGGPCSNSVKKTSNYSHALPKNLIIEMQCVLFPLPQVKIGKKWQRCEPVIREEVFEKSNNIFSTIRTNIELYVYMFFNVTKYINSY